MRIVLPKRWPRAKRKAARVVIRYDVAKMIAIDRYTDTLFRVRAEAFELFSQQIAETFAAWAGGMPIKKVSRDELLKKYGEDE